MEWGGVVILLMSVGLAGRVYYCFFKGNHAHLQLQVDRFGLHTRKTGSSAAVSVVPSLDGTLDTRGIIRSATVWARWCHADSAWLSQARVLDATHWNRELIFEQKILENNLT